MKDGRFWLAVGVSGVVMNVVDTIFHGFLFAGPIYQRYSGVFRQDESLMPFYILGDFVAVLVVAWAYLRLRTAFRAGWRGGAHFGLYAGMLMSFPLYLFTYLTIEGYPYWVAWVMTAYGISWGIVAGAVIGALMSPRPDQA